MNIAGHPRPRATHSSPYIAGRLKHHRPRHPLKAIGIVATIIVFVSAMLVKEGWALLSVLERS
jgi:hypothetical protein